MIISYSTSNLINIANIANNYIKGYKSEKLNTARQCILDRQTEDNEKEKKMRISNPIYLKYAELCTNEEWKTFFTRLVSNKIKKSATQTYNNQYFKAGRASKNSTNVFIHPEEIDLVALISFQKFLKSKSVFMSEEDRDIIHIEATTSSNNSKAKKIDKKKIFDKYINSSKFSNDCKEIGIKNIKLASDQVVLLIEGGIIKQNQIIYDNDNIIEIKNLSEYLNSYCKNCFVI